MNADFNNSLTGTFRVSAGSAVLGSGQSSGMFVTAAEASLTFVTPFGRWHALLDGVRFTGAGAVRMDGPYTHVCIKEGVTVTVENPFVMAGGALSDGPCNQVPHQPAHLIVTNSLRRDGLYGAILALTGTTTVRSGATLDILANWRLDAGTLINEGTGTWTRGQSFQIDGIFENRGTFVLTAGEGELRSFDNAGGTFRNASTVRKTGAGSVLVQCSYANGDTAAVDVQAGWLGLRSGASGGTFAVAAGAELRFPRDTHVLHEGTALVGDGVVRITSLLGQSGDVSVEGTVTVEHLVLESGAVTGPGTLTVTGTFDWTGMDGTMAGTGVTRIDAAATLNINGRANLNGRTLVIDGYAQWYDSGTISLNNATITNNGYFVINHQDNREMSGFGVFNNAGILTKAGPAQTTLYVLFSNGGYVGASEGALNIAGAYVQNAGGITDVGPGATLAAASFTVEQDGLLMGSGTVRSNVTNRGTVSPGGDGAVGTLTIQGNYTQDGTGVLLIKLGYDEAGPVADQLHVTGNAMLMSGSTLRLTVLDSFFCNPDDSFDVLRVDGTLTGEFSLLDGLPDCLTPQYGDHGLSLVVGT